MKNRKSASLKMLQSMRVNLLKRPGRAVPNLRELFLRLKKIGGTRLPVDVLIVDDARIARLAGKFRASPRATDVLAFYYGDDDLMGEIAISADTAARQAKERGVKIVNELTLLCIHGLLHLAGEDDETYEDWFRMKSREFETMMKIL